MQIPGNSLNSYSYLYTRTVSATEPNPQIPEKTSHSNKVEQVKDSRAAASPPKPITSDSVNRTLLREQEEGLPFKKVTLDTGRGKEAIDIDEYFAPKSGPVNLDDVPLLLFSDHNINALSAHAEEKMKTFLKEHGIPSAPDKITYGNDGQIKLPADYEHKNAFKQALESDPAMARELQTIAALTGHNVAIEKAMNGGGRARTYTEIALNFGADGGLSITANGEPFKGGEAANTAHAAADSSEGTASKTDPVKEFLDYMKMTPEERYYAMFLAEEGLTQEQLEALPPEERAKIEKKIQAKIEEKLKQDVKEIATGGAESTLPLDHYQQLIVNKTRGEELHQHFEARINNDEKLGAHFV